MKIFMDKHVDLSEGQQLVFHNTSETPMRPGDSFPIFENNQRVALARVVEDCSKDPRFSIPFLHGHGPTNSARNILRAEVEVVYDRD